MESNLLLLEGPRSLSRGGLCCLCCWREWPAHRAEGQGCRYRPHKPAGCPWLSLRKPIPEKDSVQVSSYHGLLWGREELTAFHRSSTNIYPAVGPIGFRAGPRISPCSGHTLGCARHRLLKRQVWTALSPAHGLEWSALVWCQGCPMPLMSHPTTLKNHCFCLIEANRVHIQNNNKKQSLWVKKKQACINLLEVCK